MRKSKKKKRHSSGHPIFWQSQGNNNIRNSAENVDENRKGHPLLWKSTKETSEFIVPRQSIAKKQKPKQSKSRRYDSRKRRSPPSKYINNSDDNLPISEDPRYSNPFESNRWQTDSPISKLDRMQAHIEPQRFDIVNNPYRSQEKPDFPQYHSQSLDYRDSSLLSSESLHSPFQPRPLPSYESYISEYRAASTQTPPLRELSTLPLKQNNSINSRYEDFEQPRKVKSCRTGDRTGAPWVYFRFQKYA